MGNSFSHVKTFILMNHSTGVIAERGVSSQSLLFSATWILTLSSSHVAQPRRWKSGWEEEEGGDLSVSHSTGFLGTWVWKAVRYSTQGSPRGLTALSPVARPSVLQAQGAPETPFEDVVSRSCAMGTLAHRWGLCFETKPGSLCSSVTETAGISLWVGAQCTSNSFCHLTLAI